MNNRRVNIYIQFGFVLSLILNAFLLGFIMAGPSWHGPPRPDPIKRLYEAARSLPPESQAKVMNIINHHDRDLRFKREHGDVGFKEIKDILTAKELELDKLDNVFNDMAARHEEMGTLIGTMFKDIAAAIPEDDKRVEFFEQALPPPPPFNKGPPPTR